VEKAERFRLKAISIEVKSSAEHNSGINSVARQRIAFQLKLSGCHGKGLLQFNPGLHPGLCYYSLSGLG